MVDARVPEKTFTDRRVRHLNDRQFRVFVMATLWAVGNRTDGAILSADLNLIPGATKPIAAALVASGLWEQERDGWSIVDFEVTQTSREQLEQLDEKRRKAAEKKRRQRERLKSDDPIDAGEGEQVSPGDVPGDTEGDGTGSGSGQARILFPEEGEPPLFCSDHPSGTADRCVACGNARRVHEAWLRKTPKPSPFERNLQRFGSAYGRETKTERAHRVVELGQQLAGECPQHPGYPASEAFPCEACGRDKKALGA